MKHLGDITKIDGHNVPLVDVICGGSPCQDLSVAGKRAGLAGQRSGLFMDQIRIIKEMRDESKRRMQASGASIDAKLVQPRYMVWENVPGAFSSNGGEDFRAVIEETAKVACESAVVPRPQGKWSTSGCIMGEGWSIAWRVHDAQFWGVPQRRKRIALVADFGGASAPEILFEREGVSGDSDKSEEEGKEASRAAGESADSAVGLQGSGTSRVSTVVCLNDQGGEMMSVSEDKTATLRAEAHGHQPIVAQEIKVFGVSSYGQYSEDVSSLRASGGDYGDGSENLAVETTPARIAVGCDVYNQTLTGDVSASLTAAVGGTNTSGGKVLCVDQGGEKSQCGVTEDVAPTLATTHGGEPAIKTGEVTSVVRRLTPLECERLQNYPDGWTDIGDWVDSKGKKHKGDSDSPRYKALGNSIALPFWDWMAGRICAQYDRPVTMASLFDGIGGFPLCFQRHGATPVWASEIEEFPIAVTKKRFPETEEKKN